MSSASRKYQEVVLIGKTDSPSSWLFAPAPGIERYEVWSAFACQVIGPLSPGTWKLTASLRPASSELPGSRAKGKVTASLQAESPGAIVTVRLPPKVTGRLVSGTRAELVRCRPTKTASNVTGLVPSVLEKRRRASRPQISGLRTSRNDWSRAPVISDGNATFRSGCADGLPIGYGP